MITGARLGSALRHGSVLVGAMLAVALLTPAAARSSQQGTDPYQETLFGTAERLGLPNPITAASTDLPTDCIAAYEAGQSGDLPSPGDVQTCSYSAVMGPETTGFGWGLVAEELAGRVNSVDGPGFPIGPNVSSTAECRSRGFVLILDDTAAPFEYRGIVDLFEVAERGWEDPFREAAAAAGAATEWEAVSDTLGFGYSEFALSGGTTVHVWSATGLASGPDEGSWIAPVGSVTERAVWREQSVLFLVERLVGTYAYTWSEETGHHFEAAACPLPFDVGTDAETWVRSVHEAAVSANLTGVVGLRASAPGYGADDRSFSNTEGLAAVAVSGMVTDQATGDPVPGATVEVLNGAMAAPATTGADGRYSLTVLFGGGDETGALTMDFALPPRAPGLEVSVSPPFLQQIGDAATVRVRLSGPDGSPSASAPVRVTGLAEGSPSLEMTTGPDGEAVFPVYHLDPAVTAYRLRIEGNGLSSEVVIPVAGIAVETNPATGEPYLGVAADGVSALTIAVSAAGLADGEVTASARLGSLYREGSEEALIATEVVALDTSGTATLVYRPPDYLEDPTILRQVPHADDGAARGADDTVTITLRAADGTEAVIPLTVGAFRPPVLLVHGFVGTPETWAALDEHLSALGFDTQRGRYSGQPTDDIPSNAAVLSDNITRRLDAYIAAGIKAGRVDVVAHSMGGLITRYHIGTAEHPAVRKLIMVATPNHGIGPFDEVLAELAAMGYDAHDAAADQLYWDSPFLRSLNAGEATGAHLDPAVEYANLFGTWSYGSKEALVIEAGIVGYVTPVGALLPAASAALLLEAQSDGVVTAGSARLNGVEQQWFPGVCHSPDLPSAYCSDPGVTVDTRVWTAVEERLLRRIYPADLAGSSMEVSFDGVVLIKDYGEEDAAWASPPSPAALDTWQVLRTGPASRAVVSFRIGGTEWGRIEMDEESEIVVDYALPQQVRLWHRAGKIKLSAYLPAGDFLVEYLGEAGRGTRARVAGVGTEFALDATDPVRVEVLGGMVYTDAGFASIGAGIVGTGAAATLGTDGVPTAAPVSTDPWWDHPFFRGGGAARWPWVAAALLALGGLAMVGIAVLRRPALVPRMPAPPPRPVAELAAVGLALSAAVAAVTWLVARLM